MKTMKTVLTSFALIALFSVSVMAQSGAKVIAVVNKADWCHVCQENGSRAMSVLKENNKDGAVQFVANDLTNDKTKAKCTTELKKVGLDEAVAGFKYTGMVYFFNADSKELISEISVAKSDQELVVALTKAAKETM
jgi:thiol:disulfide interchange protein